MKIKSKQLTEIVGISAVVLSLMFVGYEMRLSRSVAQSESISQRVDLYLNINEQITTNSEVWAKGCLGQELTPSEAIEFTNIVSSLIGYEFYRWNRAIIGITDAPVVNAPRLVGRNLYNFPGFNAVWNKAGQGSVDFQEAVIEQYDLLVDSGVEKELDVSRCGK